MGKMTMANLQSAFGGESMAHMRYLTWADKAEKDKFPNVARLLRAISRAEQAHANGHFMAMRDAAGAASVTAGGEFGLGSTSDNLAAAIEGEMFEVEEMYPAYLEVARAQSHKAAVRSMEYALQAERIHVTMYTKAKEAVDDGKDVELGPVHICPICGYTHEGEAPDKCPVCNADKRVFVTFEA